MLELVLMPLLILLLVADKTCRFNSGSESESKSISKSRSIV